MATPKRVGDLEIPQDLGFQRREWIAERVGWALMLLIAVAALLGVFGRGWLSQASAGSQHATARLHYERFTRLFSSTELTVALTPIAVTSDTVRIWFDRGFLQGVQVLDVVPRPSSVEAGTDRLTYVFPVSTPGRALTITFLVQPQHPWSHTGSVGVPHGQTLRFSQFVYP